MTDPILDHATAADAAVLQLAEGADALSKGANVEQHPANALYRATIEAILPTIESFAAAKNVPIEPHELQLIADAVLGTSSRNTMRDIQSLDPEAIPCLHEALDRVLDTMMLTRFCTAILILENRPVHPAAVYASAAQSLKRFIANDTPAMKIIWPGLSAMVADYYAHLNGSRPFIKPLSGMADYGISCTVQRSV